MMARWKPRMGYRASVGFGLALAAAALVALQTDAQARQPAPTLAQGQQRGQELQIKTSAGLVEGRASTDGRVHAFKGIPFAAPPVGDLRWRAPQPVAPWTGVRQATAFGARCMQGRIFEDIVFRDEMSEDCLFANVWRPAPGASSSDGSSPDRVRLPVMVWIHGGAFQVGSTSEPRQDGEQLARKGVVVVSLNYRVGLFGFFAHPELSMESSFKASGNYGLMDLATGLQWVKTNIEAFGGDPGNVTIFGESAGSFAVSALMASPLSRGQFHKAIGESGAFFTAGPLPLAPRTLAASEEAGATFASSIGAQSLAALRAKPAGELLEAALKGQGWFSPIVDGYVLAEEVYATFKAGKQSRVPLLAGWNADEARAGVVLAKEPVIARTFTEGVRERFGARTDAVLKLYPAGSDAEAVESAASLAGDLLTGYATWKWLEMHAATGRSPVYRFSFDRKIPIAPDTRINGRTATAKDIGARHAGEIEYVFGMLDSVAGVTWEASDRSLSDAMMTYWSSFARTGTPGGSGLPAWPRYTDNGRPVMHLDETIRVAPETQRGRYEFLDRYTASIRTP